MGNLVRLEIVRGSSWVRWGNLLFGYGPKTACTGNLLPYSRLWTSLELRDINSSVEIVGFVVSTKWFYEQALTKELTE